MRKTLLAALLIVIAGLAQGQLLAPKGIKAGATTLSVSELSRLSGVTSSIQAQLNSCVKSSEGVLLSTQAVTFRLKVIKRKREPSIKDFYRFWKK